MRDQPVFGVVFGPCSALFSGWFGLICGLVFQPVVGLVFGPVFGLMFGLVFVPVFGYELKCIWYVI